MSDYQDDRQLLEYEQEMFEQETKDMLDEVDRTLNFINYDIDNLCVQKDLLEQQRVNLCRELSPTGVCDE